MDSETVRLVSEFEQQRAKFREDVREQFIENRNMDCKAFLQDIEMAAFGDGDEQEKAMNTIKKNINESYGGALLFMTCAYFGITGAMDDLLTEMDLEN